MMFPDERVLFVTSIVLQRDFYDWLQEIPTLVILPDDDNFILCICYRIMALCLCNMFVLFEALRESVLHADWDRFI